MPATAVQYATIADFNEHGLPAVALDGYTGDLNKVLAKASGKVNSYLRGRYTVPLTAPYPDEIIQATCTLAAYDLLSVRGFDANSPTDMSVRERFDDLCGRPGQTGWLDKISQGRITLDPASDTTSSSQEGGPIVLGTGTSQCERHNGAWHSRDDCWRFW